MNTLTIRNMVAEEFRSNRYGITLSLEEQKHCWLGFADRAIELIALLKDNKEDIPDTIEALEILVKIGTENYSKICASIKKREAHI